MVENKKFGFVGGGCMSEAIISGLLAGGMCAEAISVTDISGDRLAQLKEAYGVQTVPNSDANDGLGQLCKTADVVVLAVKPQVAPSLFDYLAGPCKERLVISIIGGITIKTLEKQLGTKRLIRVMPNTPMLVGKGVAGVAAAAGVSDEDTALAMRLFETVGTAYRLPEEQIDAMTGVSGCGPAFAYLFAEALADGGVAEGLPRAIALEMAAQTLVGAGEMLLQTKKHPGQLKDDVTSPGGGTIQGVKALEEGGLRAAVINAVTQSVKRMQELG